MVSIFFKINIFLFLFIFVFLFLVGTQQCLICFDEDELVALPCGHAYCGGKIIIIFIDF